MYHLVTIICSSFQYNPQDHISIWKCCHHNKNPAIHIGYSDQMKWNICLTVGVAMCQSSIKLSFISISGAERELTPWTRVDLNSEVQTVGNLLV